MNTVPAFNLKFTKNPTLDCTYYPNKPINPDCFCEDRSKYNKLTDEDIKKYDKYCWDKVNKYSLDEYCQKVTPEQFDISCYCKYPDAYKNEYFNFTQEQLNNMDKKCIEFNKQDPQSPEVVKIAEEVGDKSIDKLTFIISDMFSEEGLKELLKFFGVVEGGKLFMRVMLNSFRGTISTMLGEEFINRIAVETAENILGTAGAVMFEENFAEGLAGAALGMAIEEAYGATSIATLAAASVAEFLTVGLNVAFIIYDLVMLSGMLLDMIDPYGFNNQLSGENLLDISNKFNTIFMQVVLAHLRLPEGNNWPMEFFADNLISKTDLGEDFTRNKIAIMSSYQTQYLNSLIVNSRGQFIYRNQNEKVNKDNLPYAIRKADLPSKLLSINNTMLYLYGNDNIVVSNWINRNWLLILLLVIIIIIIALMIK